MCSGFQRLYKRKNVKNLNDFYIDYMLQWQHFGYNELNKILHLIKLVSFYFLMWLLENFKSHMKLAFATHIVFLLDSGNLDRVCVDIFMF